MLSTSFPRSEKGSSGCVLEAEPSQNKWKRARSLINRQVNKSIGKSRSQQIERSIGRWMRGCVSS